MSLHFHPWTRRQIHRLFAGGLAPTRHRALLRELRGCPACNAVFRQYHAFEAALCGAPGSQEEPNRLAAERIASGVFGLMPAERPASASLNGRLGFLAPAAVLACAAMVLFAVRATRPPSQHVRLGEDSRLAAASIVARGRETSPNAETGFRLLRVVPRQEQVDEASALLLSDVVTFTYTNLRKEMRYLALFGIQEDGAVRWYYPGAESGQSVLIEADRIDEPLNDGIRLSVFHRPGWLRVAAVFSKQPIEKAAVEQAVRALAARDGALRGLEPLPLAIPSSIEDSIRVEVLAPMAGGNGGMQ